MNSKLKSCVGEKCCDISVDVLTWSSEYIFRMSLVLKTAIRFCILFSSQGEHKLWKMSQTSHHFL